MAFICIGFVTLILTYHAQIKTGDKWNSFLVYVFSVATYLCALFLKDIETESEVLSLIYSIFAIFFMASTLFVTLAIKPDKFR